MSVDMHPVQSSNLRAVGYDPEMRVLLVQFRSGATYEYDDVPQTVYEGLLGAQSKGRYVAQNVKGQYDCQRRT